MRKYILLLLLLIPNFCYAAPQAQYVPESISGYINQYGTALAGGTIELFTSDSLSVYKAVYSDAQKTTVVDQATTQPNGSKGILLSDAGQPIDSVGNTIALFGDGTYWIRLKDYTGAVVKTYQSLSYQGKVDFGGLYIDIAGSYGRTDTALTNALIAYDSGNAVTFLFNGGNFINTSARTIPSNIKLLFVNGANLTNSGILNYNGQLTLEKDSFLTNSSTITLIGSIKFEDGAYINNTGTITFNNTSIDAPLENIFQGAGAYVGNINNIEAYPEWWGAIKNQELVDNAIAINKAISFSDNVKLGIGEYWINSQINLKNTRGSTFSGSGEKTLIYGNFVGKMIVFNANRTTIKDFTIEGGSSVTDLIYSDTQHRCSIKDISMHRSGGNGIHLNNSYIWDIYRLKSRYDNATNSSYPRISKICYFENVVNQVNLFDPYLEEATDAIVITASQFIKIYGGVIEDCYGYALYATHGSSHIFLDGTYLESSRRTSNDGKYISIDGSAGHCNFVTLRDLKMSNALTTENASIYLNEISYFEFSGGNTQQIIYDYNVQNVHINGGYIGQVSQNYSVAPGTGLWQSYTTSKNELWLEKNGVVNIGNNNYTGDYGSIKITTSSVSLINGGNTTLKTQGYNGFISAIWATDRTHWVWLPNNNAPISGNWIQGDIGFYPAPVASGNIGVVCVSSGTPGTWKTWGIIAP